MKISYSLFSFTIAMTSPFESFVEDADDVGLKCVIELLLF